LFSEKKLQTVFSIKREVENSENKLKIPNTVFCNLEYFGIVDKVVNNNQRSDQQEKYIYHLPA